MVKRAAPRFVLGVAGYIVAACGAPVTRSSAEAEEGAGCSYVAELVKSHLLVVNVRCRGASPTGFRAEPEVAPYVSELRDASGTALKFDGDTVWLDGNAGALGYRVDLHRMAGQKRDFDYALRVGDSVIAPGYSWLLAPVQVPDDLPVSVRVAGRDREHRFVSGMASNGRDYTLRANELRVATYGVFGRFESDVVELDGFGDTAARIDIATLDGPTAVGRNVRNRWVRETSAAVARFYGGFPTERALLAIVPVPGRASVLHGKVLPESNPGVALLLGSDAGPEDLYADWILTHELFHLGFPSFVEEGKWLDEGLATYFEPLIRARKRWLTEVQVWSEFVHNMPRGLSVMEQDGLENPKNMRGMYWAGATVALMADVQALEHTNGTRGLQHALRKLLRDGGEASRVWRLRDVIRHVDASLGAPILSELAERYATPGRRVPLAKLFEDLGVRKAGRTVTFDDEAPLADVRRAITRGVDSDS